MAFCTQSTAAVLVPSPFICHKFAGLHTVKLQQLCSPSKPALMIQALASLLHLRNLDMS
jgi:hypothetical protein